MNQSGLGLIIGGAAKSGTTAIYYYLRQHPDFFLPEKKELHFFSRSFLERTAAGPGDRFVLAEIPKTFDEYLSAFQRCDGRKVAVDVSPSYIFHYEAAEGIRHHLGDARIVFILRNPVEKAFSQYLHLVGEGRETLSFEEALEKEEERRMHGFSDIWLYKTCGYYARALEHYIRVFGREKVKIFYYDEFLRYPQGVLHDICAFAGTDASFQFTPISAVNRSGDPKSLLVAKLLAPNILTYVLRRVVPQSLGRFVRAKMRDWNTGAKPKLADHIREGLLLAHMNDLRRVEAIIGRPSGWVD